MNKGELDVSYITSRLIVMSYPAEGVESAIKNHIDDVREFLETHHPGSYTIYNLSNRSYRTVKFHNRVYTATVCIVVIIIIIIRQLLRSSNMVRVLTRCHIIQLPTV